MEIIKLIQLFDIDVGELALIIVALLTIVQITPIKINPWSWIARHIGRAINGDVLTKVDNLEKKIENLEGKMRARAEKEDERSAVNYRVRILRFEDELQDGRHHSKDSFDQVLSDIKEYNDYCDDHPKFKNNQTAATVKHIEDVYYERLNKRDFS